MDFFENIGSKLTQAGSGAQQRIKKMQNVSALNSHISKLEKSIHEAYLKLGESYYSSHSGDEAPEFSDIIGTITDAKKQIEAAQTELKAIRALTTCQKCGANLKEGFAFCSACGAKVERPAPPAAANVCAGCGAPILGDASFCTKCGRRIEAPAVKAEAQPASEPQPIPEPIPQPIPQPDPTVEDEPEPDTELAEAAETVFGATAAVFEPTSEASEPPVCPDCGKALRSGAKFCTGCGRRIE
ncbi:MAG: zinc ribbon domain-containing protein [Clostridia bacterium]|nr:zinc ribbon domain-containing protein [Clostridia bacterium]